MINSFLRKSSIKPSKKEIKFLQSHTKELIKILTLVSTIPTPIPYMLITIILSKFNISLLPFKKELEIPEEYNDYKVRKNNNIMYHDVT